MIAWSVKIRYQLVVLQQPTSVSSSCFHGDAPRRKVVTPCPIFQLVATKKDGSQAHCASQLGDVSCLLAHAIIVAPDGVDASFLGVGQHQCQDEKNDTFSTLNSRNLDGTIVSICYLLRDLDGSLKAYFVFQDLSVNFEGKYKLKVCVSEISGYILLRK